MPAVHLPISETPVPVIDIDVVAANLKRWQFHCDGLGVAHNGRKFRMLNIIDEFTRKCLDMRVDRKHVCFDFAICRFSKRQQCC
jgi:hypothetical protein